MKKIILLFILLMNQLQEGSAQTFSYLALGDSYTIGESVPLYESFPYQTVQALRKSGIPVQAPEIVAKTGWTTDELMAGINKTTLLKRYDFVSLLVGVNNQYRGRNREEFAKQFEELLVKAIELSGGKKQSVFVISIPDWGATPFAEGRDRNKIESEINAFNTSIKQITTKHQIRYIEITEGSRAATVDATLVAKDKLHPSGKEYAKWAEKLAKAIEGSIQQ